MKTGKVQVRLLSCAFWLESLLFWWLISSHHVLLLFILHILQAGIYLIELLDEFCGGIPFIIIGLFMCSALAWIYNVRHFCTDIKQMTGSKVGLWWRVMWCFFTPVIIVVSLVLSLQFTVLLKCILLCNKCPPHLQGLHRP